MQLWPANENAFAASLAAVSAGASAQTIAGVAFPSSSLTRLRCARSASDQPTPLDPVKVINLTRSSATSASPIVAAEPETTLSQPGGRPASCSSSARNSAEKGVAEAGLSTTAQPAASAGAILCATRLSGKLKGEMAPTIPIGSRSVSASFPAPAGDASIGTTSPARRRASTAANVYVDAARCASTLAALSGLPASAEIVWAASSRRSSSRRATVSRMRARSCAGNGVSIAAAAASSARRASAAPPRATRPITSPE